MVYARAYSPSQGDGSRLERGDGKWKLEKDLLVSHKSSALPRVRPSVLPSDRRSVVPSYRPFRPSAFPTILLAMASKRLR